MPIISNTGAGAIRSLTPSTTSPTVSRGWQNITILTNNEANVLAGNTVYTNISKASLHNTLVYKNIGITQRLRNTCFRQGEKYFYADNNGWTVAIHNFNGYGDTYITGPQSIVDFRTENYTIEMFVYAKSLPSWEYAAYFSVGEPNHCRRAPGFFSTVNHGFYGSQQVNFSVGYSQWPGYSSINPGMGFCGMNNQVISHDYDSERPVMQDGFMRNEWHHVAVTRHNGGLRLYFNGALVDSRLITTTNTDYNASVLVNPLAIGCRVVKCFGDTYFSGMWDGFISDVRVIKSQALYTGVNLTVPSRPLTATGHRNGSQNITGEIRLLACQENMSTIGPALQRTLRGY
jgi:hypothetical protein